MEQKPVILIVDDTPENLRVLGDMLEQEGFEVQVARNGAAALKNARAHPAPDLILLDIMMPIMNGYEVCRQLKADPALKHIPVIFISALGMADQKIQAFREGAVDYVTKPFQAEEVVARVHTHIQLARNEELKREIGERRQKEEFLAFLAQTSSGRGDEPFFNKLARYLAQSLGMDVVRIDRLEGDGLTARPLAVWCDGHFLEHGIYALKDTPCGGVAANEVCCFPTGVVRLFPGDRALLELRAESYVCVPLTSHGGRPIGLIAVIGRTELKNTSRAETMLKLVAVRAAGELERLEAEEEKEKLAAQLQQAQKLESVGRLAGGIAHDFNNMLTIILGHADLALQKLDPTHPLHADLTEILHAAERSSDLTRQLLAFARKQTIAPKVMDLNESVAGMLKMLQRLIGEEIDLTFKPAATLWPVMIDPSQLDQILANLCVNARDAIAGIGLITIGTDNRLINGEYCSLPADAAPGEYAMLTVSDNGCGMDKDILARIFEPFFTTKGVGVGTGLGLATVYGIIKQNDGFVTVYSEPGEGTTFTVYFPRHLGHDGPGLAAIAVEPAMRGRETVLVVEDEPVILRMTAMILAQLGYTVLAAGSPAEALRLAAEQTGKIHLLITDVVMPGMNGHDLAKKLAVRYPQLKCLFMSGYTADVIAHRGVLDDGVQFIQKPFTMLQLAARVREALMNG